MFKGCGFCGSLTFYTQYGLDEEQDQYTNHLVTKLNFQKLKHIC